MEPMIQPRDCRDDDALDLDALLHPALAFGHPMNVINDPDFTLSEKRAVLASWASDICTVEAAPPVPGAPQAVRFDDVMDALRLLDEQARHGKKQPHYKRVLAKRRPGVFGRNSPGQGHGGQGALPN
jgi:hypothetical protein